MYFGVFVPHSMYDGDDDDDDDDDDGDDGDDDDDDDDECLFKHINKS